MIYGRTLRHTKREQMQCSYITRPYLAGKTGGGREEGKGENGKRGKRRNKARRKSKLRSPFSKKREREKNVRVGIRVGPRAIDRSIEDESRFEELERGRGGEKGDKIEKVGWRRRKGARVGENASQLSAPARERKRKRRGELGEGGSKTRVGRVDTWRIP